MISRQFVGSLAGAMALFAASAASASVVVENVGFGYSGSEDVAIGGDTLILQTTPTYGPQTLHIYDTLYGGSSYASTFQGEALSLGGLGGQISFTPGGLLSGGALIQAGTATVSSEILGGYQDNYTTALDYHAVPFSYSCGFSTCTGFDYFAYTLLVNEGDSSTASPLGYGASGYLGLDLLIGGQTHFGWAEVQMGGNSLQPTLDIVQLAYETSANTSIAAGATSDVAVVPEPGSLALLIAGLAVSSPFLKKRTKKLLSVKSATA